MKMADIDVARIQVHQLDELMDFAKLVNETQGTQENVIMELMNESERTWKAHCTSMKAAYETVVSTTDDEDVVF